MSINARGTGSSVVGTLLLRRLGIDAELVHEDTRRAISRIKAGELAAHFNVLGKPTKVVSGIDGEGLLHLLPIPYATEMQDIYLPSELTSEDYPNLIPPGETVQTLAVGNVLATFNWAEDTERGRKVKRFVDAFFSRFEELKEEGYSPKWKQVNLAADIPGWTRLEAAQHWLDAHPPEQPEIVGRSPELREEFTTFLVQNGLLQNANDGNREQVDALFQQFVEWRTQQ